MKLLFLGDKAGHNTKLTKELRKQNHTATVIIFQEKMYKFLEESGNLDNGEIKFAPDLGIVDTSSLVNYIKKESPDMIFSSCFTSLLRASFQTSIPWAIIFYGTDLREGKLAFTTKLLLKFFKIKKNRFFIVTTPDLLKYKRDATFFPGPINSDFWCPMDVPQDKDVIFFPHRFDSAKGVDTIMTAWKLLEDKNLRIKLIDWGDRISEFKERFGDKNITYLPFMTEEKLKEEINKSSIIWGQFKYPLLSYGEAYGLCCNKIVISNDLSSIPVEYDPPTFQCSTPEQLANLTLEKINNPPTDVNFREWILKTHDRKNVAEMYLELIKSTI